MKKILTLLLSLILLVGCNDFDEKIKSGSKPVVGKKYKSSFIEFSTVVNLTIYNYKGGVGKFDQLIRRVKSIFKYFDQEMNPSLENSTLANLNRECQNISPKFVKIPFSLKSIIEESDQYFKDFHGYFDPAVYNLVEEWGFINNSKPKLLSEKSIQASLANIGWKNIILNGDSIAFKNSEVGIGFGAIAKGGAVDSVASFLLQEGVKEFIIDAGGDLLVKGKKKLIGIRDPRQNGLLDPLNVSNLAEKTD